MTGDDHPATGRNRAEGEREMKSYNPDPDLPDDVSIDQVRLPPRIKALVAAGLKTVERVESEHHG
jgi:hypothetical protein